MKSPQFSFLDSRRAFDAKGRLLELHEWPQELDAGTASGETVELYTGAGEQRIPVGVTR